MALPRHLSTAAHDAGCPKLRPASINPLVGPRGHPGHVGHAGHAGLASFSSQVHVPFFLDGRGTARFRGAACVDGSLGALLTLTPTLIPILTLTLTLIR